MVVKTNNFLDVWCCVTAYAMRVKQGDIGQYLTPDFNNIIIIDDLFSKELYTRTYHNENYLLIQFLFIYLKQTFDNLKITVF